MSYAAAVVVGLLSGGAHLRPVGLEEMMSDTVIGSDRVVLIGVLLATALMVLFQLLN